jgi:4-amino-4-deoxy-L-arabinose transferase-like glycosyltransferase
MFFFQEADPNQKIPFTTKLTLVFWVIVSLALLSFFAFGIFLVALMVGLFLFATNLFQKKKRSDSIPYSGSQTRAYKAPRNIKDDDVIDI